MNWEQILTYGFIVGLISGGIRLSVPIVLAAIGETYSQRAGILNIGIEGMMVTGAFVGFIGAKLSGDNLFLGVIAAALAGAIMGLIMAVFSVTLQANQTVTGISLLMLSNGIAIFFFRVLYGLTSRLPTFKPLRPIPIPYLSKIPFFGPTLFNQDILVYVTLIIAVISTVFLFKTPFGKWIQATGENSHAADSMGVNVVLVRYVSVIIGGMLASVGGAYLSIGELGLWTDLIVGGRGFIALALVNFGGWNPLGALAGGLLFGLIEAAQTRFQGAGIPVPGQLMIAMPYIMTILVLIIASRRGGLAPADLTKPFVREDCG